MKHKHHIVPRYEGGSDDPSNLVELTVTQHAMWHFAEWQRKRNWQDSLAHRVLLGRISGEEAYREAVRENNRKRKGEVRPPRTPEVKRKIQESLWKYWNTTETGRVSSSLGGRNSKGRKPKPIELYSLRDNYSFTFDSAVKAGEALGLNPSYLTKMARGEWESYKGWVSRYI
jgi:hypothetical protein